jgi:hypothetical protein
MIDLLVPSKTTPEAGASAPAAPSLATADLFSLGREATARARALHGPRGVFTRSRQLLPTGVWKGPRDAADAYVEGADLPQAGGLDAAIALGVRTVLATDPALAREAAGRGLRVLLRLPFRAGEPEADRAARLDAARALAQAGAGPGSIAGVVPTPVGEPFGLDTLALFARCRLALDVPHVVADFVALGHRLAQMALAFGADELLGPIMPERALRLGANAHNPVMTRKEAATVIRGAGLVPHERLGSGAIEEFQP